MRSIPIYCPRPVGILKADSSRCRAVLYEPLPLPVLKSPIWRVRTISATHAFRVAKTESSMVIGNSTTSPFISLSRKGGLDFAFNPSAVDRVLRQDEEQFVSRPNGLLYRRTYFVPDTHMFWSKPTIDTIVLHIRVQSCSELRILFRVANEA